MRPYHSSERDPSTLDIDVGRRKSLISDCIWSCRSRRRGLVFSDASQCTRLTHRAIASMIKTTLRMQLLKPKNRLGTPALSFR